MPDGCTDPSPPRRVFVYGTLRRGGSNDITRLHPAPRFIGVSKVQGTLYRLGHYPGLRLGAGGWVVGEVYEVAPALEAVLDLIEDLGPQPTDEYAKKDILLDVGGELIQCFLYEVNPAYVATAPKVPGGNWLAPPER
jgi:gamma-glutamylcyclotransferase (GGCT)/AIG2-like uncharacterized protein YtfP